MIPSRQSAPANIMDGTATREPAAPRGMVRLADHVRACVCGDQVVLMDLSQDRYLGVGAAAAAGLAQFVSDWPGARTVDLGTTVATRPSPLVQRLLAQGLLTTKPSTQVRVVAPKATRSLDVLDQVPYVRARAADLAHLALAAAKAAAWLRFRSLNKYVDAIGRSRLSRADADPQTLPFRLRENLAVYEKLRPLLFTARDQCLLDSFALLHFLACRGIAAHGVLGVRTHPFRAHAWVQHGDLVLNDGHEHVARFTPILVV